MGAISRAVGPGGSRNARRAPAPGTHPAPRSAESDGERTMKRASWTRRATRVALVTIAVASAAAACGRHDDRNVDSAGGAALPSDTGALRATGATMAVGPLIYVTKTDDKSVHDATQLQLTEQRMKQFMAAAESLNALRGRDTRVQQL